MKLYDLVIYKPDNEVYTIVDIIKSNEHTRVHGHTGDVYILEFANHTRNYTIATSEEQLILYEIYLRKRKIKKLYE